MWTYSQTTGALMDDLGAFVATGYSGIGPGLDAPDEQEVPNVGPIPQGSYDIGPAFLHPQCGPVAMRLTPQVGTDTFGRDGFLIHGDTASQDHTASHGCVILDRPVRTTIDASADRTLTVVE